MSATRTKQGPPPPSKWWYAVAVVVVFAGFGGMASYMLPRIESYGSSLIRFVAPGEIDMSLKEPGTYTVFHEERSVVDGRLFVSDTISGLGVSVQSMDTGESIPVVRASMNETYSFGSYAGKSAFNFDIASPGSYRLVAAYGDGRAEPRVVLTIGHNFLSGLLLTIFGGIAIVFAAIAIAIAIVVVVAQKRSTARATSTQRDTHASAR